MFSDSKVEPSDVSIKSYESEEDNDEEDPQFKVPFTTSKQYETYEELEKEILAHSVAHGYGIRKGTGCKAGNRVYV